jgi:SPP1 family predicted phage head-tail adaptor
MAKAGSMDEQITLQRFARVSDGGGGYTETWADFTTDATVWAAVTAKAGREGMDEGRTNATFVVLFEVYNRADVTELDRIMWGGVPYNIRGIRREGGRALRLVIEAERGVAS